MNDEVRAFLDEATRTLADSEVPSPAHDAESLVAHVLGTPRAGLRDDRTTFTPGQRAAAALVKRRATREPLQHLTGVAGFRHLDITVGPGVFVPRPETEILTGEAVAELARLAAAGVAHPVAVDLCTGSGAVAAALASEAPASRVIAVEIAEPAYAFAVRNAGPFGVDVRLGDMADAVDDLAAGVHVVTANPPYIPLGAFESVAPEARDHDPPLALWSGADGLDAIRVVAVVAARVLVDGGLLLCEHADAQHESAPAVFARDPRWHLVRDNPDLSGRSRFVTARRVPRAALPAGTIAL